MHGLKILRSAFIMLNVTAIFALGSCAGSRPDGSGYAYGFSGRNPYDALQHSRRAFTCSAVPDPAHDLHFESMYRKDSANASVVDPVAFATYKSTIQPISNYESRLAAMANQYLISDGAKPEYAACVQEWLYGWAKADALNGDVNRMGELVRKWVLASLASAWVEVKDEPSLDAAKTETIRAWLRKVANNVRYDFPAHDPNKSRKNNHLYWAAWAVMATGIALNQDDLYQWGLRRAYQGVHDVDKDGTLPLEVFRGRKALNYHSYAAIPLFMLAEGAAKNGTDLYKENDQALYRLARRIISGIEDPSYFERKTGQKQDLTRSISSANLVWLEPYYYRTHDPEALTLLEQFRPMRHSRVGGDLTMIYERR